MSTAPNTPSVSALDPVSRTSEILFGLIMVLTFTSSIRIAEVVKDDVREMLWGALGCNLAWGIIDAFMYLINIAAERGSESLSIRKIRGTKDANEARVLLREMLPASISDTVSEANLDQIHTSILKKEIHKPRLLITGVDLWNAAVVFALVFVTIFPVAIPFMLMEDVWRALRVSNLIALLLFFGMGYNLGRYADRSALLWGIYMTTLGVGLVAIANHFGG